MAAEELQHVALPMLYGAPAYARPVVPVAKLERPFDPDDLPLQALMTDEERAILERGPVPTLVPTETETDADARRRARGFGIRLLTGRLRGRGD
jgi:hypothetical protein